MGLVPFLVVFDLADEIFLFGAVPIGIEQHTIAGQPVAARAARLLVVALHGLGQVVMNHQAHVWFVDTHAEGDGRHHDLDLVSDELLLGFPPQVPFQTGMVGQGAETPLRQLQSRFFGELPGEPVDDGRTALVLLQKVQERTEWLGLGLDGIGQVGAVETGDEYLRLSET